jgi:hypothetical protein
MELNKQLENEISLRVQSILTLFESNTILPKRVISEKRSETKEAALNG